MKNAPSLYHSLIALFGQPAQWLDKRHLYTLAWMVVGLIESGTISLPEWTPFVDSRAQFAQSTVRRFSRWLANERIQVEALYGPIIQEALREWEGKKLYVALDTSLLWNQYCVIRLALIYRGRAIPIVWQTIEHGSSTVAFDSYRALLERAAALLPATSQVVFLADRGFADTELMAYLRDRLQWHFRIRIKDSFKVYRPGKRGCKLSRLGLQRGQARCWHHVTLTDKRLAGVHLACAKPMGASESWLIVSDEPTDLRTFEEYGLRFDIEESFLDDKSNGFEVESSQLRSADGLTRLFLVLALATLFLARQGTAVVAAGQRRWVDPHWFRGASYLKIGWRWVRRALRKGWALVTDLTLSAADDPEPAIASRQQAAKKKAKPPLALSIEAFPPLRPSTI
jgi:hypothetical protein